MPYRTTLEVPLTSDGKPIFLSNLFPGGVLSNFTGRGDNITTGVRFEGTPFVFNVSTSGEHEIEWQFMEWIYLAGGDLLWNGAEIGDWVSFLIYAPATAGNSNPGAGAYDKYSLGGGLYMYIPNAQTEGDWDLNLTEKLNSNVNFTKVVPVPAEGGNGWFDWDADTGAVTLNTEQKGGYNLFDFATNIAVFLNRVNIIDSYHDNITVPAVKPKRILPQWKYKAKINNSSAKSLKVACNLYLARKDTT